ncbi:MAG: ABC transporter substrate-binding protein [Chromatiales bacterium]|nr:ABC transporter substrate-binding protein [Chromatiales bacterium]
MAISRYKIIISAFICLCTAISADEIIVVDDWQREVLLDRPAHRIITLAPHLGELVYTAGGGDFLLGVSEHSDYPPQIRKLPIVADYRTFNQELLVKLAPDLILVWGVMLKQPVFQRLISTGYSFYISEPQDFADIAKTLEDIGVLIGQPQTAWRRAEQFRQTIASLRREQQATHRTAYLLWLKPTLSINRTSWISKAISLCGGINIYADLEPQVVRLGREALLLSKPDYIIHSLESGVDQAAIISLFGDNIPTHYVDADLIQRPSLRIVQGVEKICRIYNP